MDTQGNPGILKHALSLLEEKGREHVVLLLSEITPQKVRFYPPCHKRYMAICRKGRSCLFVASTDPKDVYSSA